ncbi:MAG: AMIN domain-containing protein [Xenococcaceae cyanobacterium]
MNNYYNRIKFLTTVALVFLVANPSKATNRQIAGVKLNSTNNGIELRLKTAGQRENNSSFFTIREDNSLEANLINTELKLREGTNFSQKNPFPGISEIEVRQLDKNNTQIAISGNKGVSVKQSLKEQNGEIILNLTPESKAKPNYLQSVLNKLKSDFKDVIAQLPGQEKVYPAPRSNNNNSPNSDVLVPNPDIVITDKNNNVTDNHLPTVENNRPYLPRAVAPPVGDMAVSNIDASPELINLGSAAIVPRLVLRDAPVREVLSLLARSAGLNLVFTDTGNVAREGEESESGEENLEKTISLDLENEPVQEVFNSVLLVSGMSANRKGNTIYVGTTLPAQARNLISRTLRLNQVQAENAALFLASQGAEGQRLTTEVEEVVDPETGRVSQRTEKPAQLQSLTEGLEEGDNLTSANLLKGLRIATDDRLNSITLIGEPRKVEIATNFLTQLDARRRQVAVNVKVIDVNLNNQDIFDSSFSFGINDSFFVQDRGTAIFNYGGVNPPERNTVNTRGGYPRVTPLPLPQGVDEANAFIDDINGQAPFSTSTPSTIGGIIFDPRGPFGSNDNPFRPGVTEVDDDGSITFELPALNEVPSDFLALLEARVISGNAKILTDPTLVVQEGQEATVKLVQNIVESVRTDVDRESGLRTITPVIGEAGLTLNVNIEQIDDNGFVSLSVNPKVTSVGASQDFDSGGGAVNTLNLLSNRELNSGLLRLRDGQTLILSGIIQDQERTTVTKVPILGDIPLLGSLFRSNNKTNERAEVIVLLTPEVIDEQSGFGYDYRPGKDAREMLQKRGFDPVPGNGQNGQQ